MLEIVIGRFTKTNRTRVTTLNRPNAIIGERKKIALIAHDNKKSDLLDWTKYNRDTLLKHELYATGTTGKILAKELGCNITIFESGPLGGDQQIGCRIAEGAIDFLIFFWDPLEPLPHDPDIKALLRVAAVWNIPVACNRTSADFIISSPLMNQDYNRILPDYEAYRQRFKQTRNFMTP
jgi:methylglyoxal synthase